MERLPRHLERELDALGVRRPRTEDDDPRPAPLDGPIWKPTKEDPDPPF